MAYVYFFLGILIGVLFYMIKLNQVQRRDNRIYNLVELSKDIIYYCDVKPKLKFRYLSPAIDNFLGENHQQESYANAYKTFERIHPDDLEILDKKVAGKVDFDKPIIQRWRNEKGKYQWFEEYATPVYKQGELVAIQGIIRNIDEQIKLKQKLEYQVIHDPLTGILNREYFERLMERYDKQINKEVAIILCDLDNLKTCNDRHGHKKGDQLIKGVATLLNQFANQTISIARIGGDEFAVIAIDIQEEQVQDLVFKMKTRINYHNEQKNYLPIEMSIGYAYSQSSVGCMDNLYIDSDKNMYQQKHLKREITQ